MPRLPPVQAGHFFIASTAQRGKTRKKPEKNPKKTRKKPEKNQIFFAKTLTKQYMGRKNLGFTPPP